MCVRAGLRGVPVGGGPPARSPHASLRLGVIDLEARPGPAAAHGHRSQAHQSLRRPPHQWGLVCWRVAWRVGSRPALAPPPPTGTAAWPRSLGRPPHRRRLVADVWLGASARSPARPRRRPRAPQPGPPVPPAPSAPVVPGRCCLARRVVSRPALALPPPIYFARNSPEACSNIEFTSLELQRFRMVSKSDRRKLCATFGQCGLCCRLRVLGSDSPAIHALVIPEAVGVLHYTKPAGGVSPACRTLV